MRAFQLVAYDTAPQIIECPQPDPAMGEVRLKIMTCGLNFADLLMIKGQYQERPPLPMILGMELSGIVDALGAGVRGFVPGMRVAVFGGSGGLAEFGCFPASQCVAMPDGMSFAQAAAFQVAYGTSHLALTHRARLQPGETLLVLGAAGGVGLGAVEIGRLLGARVIGVARGADRLDIVRAAGADTVLDSEDGDLKARLKSLGGVDVTYDPVGGPAFTAALGATRPGGRILIIGFASGIVPPIPANILLVKNISVLGFYLGAYRRFNPDALNQSTATLLNWFTNGAIAPHISHILPLDQAAAALALLQNRAATGKVVVQIAQN